MPVNIRILLQQFTQHEDNIKYEVELIRDRGYQIDGNSILYEDWQSYLKEQFIFPTPGRF